MPPMSGAFYLPWVGSLWHKKERKGPIRGGFRAQKESIISLDISISLMLTQVGQVRRLENIFWMMTLLARNMVIITLNNNKMLAHRG